MRQRWYYIGVVLILTVLGYFGLANFVSSDGSDSSWYWPSRSVRLGLDLRGGVHMVLSPDLAVAESTELEHIRGVLGSNLEKSQIRVRSGVEDGRLIVSAILPSDVPRIKEDLADLETVRTDQTGENEFTVVLTKDWRDQIRERAMLQALEVLRRRIDDPATGIPESVITRQGKDRILVQIPGVSNVPPGIIDQTGFLEFKIVEDSDISEELLTAKYEASLPLSTAIYVERDRETGRTLRAYLLPKEAAITGAYLSDARVQFDSRRSEWQVAFSWNAEGADLFGELTGDHIGDLLAIVLDDQVYSAPVIRDRISRQGTISGNFSSEEAAGLAVILRAGALPIPVILEEERTIGPALGADSINSGLRASLLGLILVVAFIAGYYRLSGGYASFALFANLTMVIGLMSLFEATLTLPGIAGLVLTVGMAVDANVIIFERIREELRQKRAIRPAIAAGFQKARWTILDANITTFITAIILYEYGTGPIKGFAVTLSIGILTSVFAALVITRLLFMVYPGNRNVTELSV